MKGVSCLVGAVLLSQMVLTARLGPESGWHVLPWLNGPVAFVAACLAFYHWLRYRRGVLRAQPIPLLPLGVALLIYAVGITPSVPARLRGREALLVFGSVVAWFTVEYVRLLWRDSRATISAREPNDRWS